MPHDLPCTYHVLTISLLSQAIGAHPVGEEEHAEEEEEVMAEPPPMPYLQEGGAGSLPLSPLYLFIAPTREATATRHAFVRR